MPHVGLNDEPLLSRSLYAYDGTLWKPVTIDSNSYLKVTLPLIENITARSYGWFNSDWRKNPLTLGLSDIWDESADGNSTATSYSFVSSTVPANEAWVLQCASLRNITRNAGETQIKVLPVSGSSMFLAFQSTSTRYVPLLFTGVMIIGTGGKVQLYMAGGAVGDGYQGGVLGYKIDLAE